MQAHFALAARMGNPVAVATVEEAPPLPDAAEYLYDWLMELFGRSGVGMDGLAPLAYTTIVDWAALTGRTVQPHEVHALMRLDSEYRHPRPEQDDGS